MGNLKNFAKFFETPELENARPTEKGCGPVAVRRRAACV